MINKNVNENIIGNDVKKISKSSKTLSLFKEDTIKYVIENFPSMSEEIQRGLLEVSVILENTIDHIEDKSSKLIKDSRNFNLSQEYRDTCISIYEVVENIKGYEEGLKKKCKNQYKCGYDAGYKEGYDAGYEKAKQEVQAYVDKVRKCRKNKCCCRF